MKKTQTLFCMLIAMCLAIPFAAFAQEMPEMPPLPRDKDVRYGTLPNGLTYYIRHNEKPKGQADFYIAQKVGSMQEEDNQRGLAHFLEHMCFNGTKNFPGNSIIDWLETKGVKFGYNLNAYTSFDETVYNISNVPVTNEAVQDSCLLILHDWANELLLEPAEIDKERSVIHQEWAKNNTGQQRVVESLLPKMMNDSKYGYRMPIGTMDVVDNFPYQTLRDYYEKWYRPDLQGIIVVGDIDVDAIEGKIKKMFGDIPKQKNPAKREYYPVPDNKETVYALGKDPEIQQNVLSISWLSDPMPEELNNTQLFYVTKYLESMIASMMNNRFTDLSADPATPYAVAYLNIGPYQGLCRTKDAITLTTLGKGNDIHPAAEAAYREVLRAAQNGFTATEYERAKQEFLSGLEKAYNNRDSRENEEFVNECVQNFLKNYAMPGIDMDYMLYQQIVPMIPVEAINQTLAQAITPQNRIVFNLTPETPDMVIPTEESLAAVFEKVDGEKIEAFVDNVKTEPLIAALPAPGKINKETKNAQWGTTEWELTNGARVIVKPTKFKEDEILMNAVALGGTAELSHKYDNSLIFGEIAFANAGLGTYTATDLEKYLKGKQVSLTPNFDDYTRDFSGTATPKDLPTLMELIYMTFTNLNYDAKEFEALQGMYAGALKNQEATPAFKFNELLLDKMTKSPRQSMITVDKINQASVKDIQEMAEALTANVADYTFIFVGNVTPETLKPLVEQYIASIPGMPAMAIRTIPEYDADLFTTPGKLTDMQTMPMEQNPQTYVAVVESGDMPYTSKNAKIASAVGQILTNRLLKTVREDWGSVYSISASGRMNRQGPANTIVSSAFPMKPADRDKVLDFFAAQLKALENDVTEEELAPVREFMQKNAKENLENNAPWLGGIAGSLINGVDTFNGAEDIIKSITVDDIRNFMKQLNSQNNYHVIVLDPAN